MKKLFKILLSALLIVSMLPISSFAFDWADFFDYSSKTKYEGEYKTEKASYELISTVYSCYGTKINPGIQEKLLCYYSDGFFEKPSTEYDEHLATLSANFAASYQEVSQTLKLLTGLNFNDIKYEDEISENSIGYVISNKKLSTGETLVSVVVRGSWYSYEWIGNVTLGMKGEAEGFKLASDTIYDKLIKYIEDNPEISKAVSEHNAKLWITGFSRGAAVSNLTAKRLVDRYGTDMIYCYSFETPAGGKKQFIYPYSDYSCIHNLMNYADVVPLFAPEGKRFEFIRYGQDHYYPMQGEDYEAQSEKMKAQLGDFAKNNNFSDSFAIAKLNINLNPLGLEIVPARKTAKSNPNKELGDWFRMIIDRITAWGVRSRISYAKKPLIIDGKAYPTIEKALQAIMKLIICKSNKNQNQLIANLANIVDTLEEKDILILLDIIQNWDSNNLLEIRGKKKIYYINLLWDKLMKAEVFTGILTDEEIAELKEVFPTLTDLLIKLFYHDLHTRTFTYGRKYGYGDIVNKASTLLTLIYNSDTLLQTHDVFSVLAWMRSYDSIYNLDD